MGFAPHQVKQWPNQDIIDLMAYDSIQPFGAIRDNWHMAVMAHLFSAAHTRKGQKPPDIKDFIYKTPEEAKAEKHQSFFAMLRAKAKNG